MMEDVRTTDPNKEMNEHLLGAENVKLRDRILLSPYTKFLLPSILVAFFVPVTVYALMISPYVLDSSYSATTCNLKTEYYVDCLPGQSPTEAECSAALCCWSDSLSLCYHTVPSQHGYTPDGSVYYEGGVLTPREKNSPLGSPNAEELYLDIAAVDSNHVAITVSRSSTSSSRKRRGFKSSYNPSDPGLGEEDQVTQRLLYFLPRDRRRRTVEIELDASSTLNAYVHYPEFSVTVARDDFAIDEGSSILSTARGPFIFTETYWEWTLYLTNGSLYGLNDLELNGTTNTIYSNENGTITPAFLAISLTGEAAAYYIDYKGPLQVQVLNVSNLVILRGMALPDDLVVHVLAGPTPLEAVQQLTLALSSSVETPAKMPSLYNYGLHICPDGNFTSVEEAVAELTESIELLANVDAPWDSHCLHDRIASFMNHFLTVDDLDAVNAAKSLIEESGRTFSPHLSPMVLADEGALHVGLEESGLLLTNGSSAYVGLYQESNVVYPDWENSEVKTIATSQLIGYLNDTGSPGSVWIRDAWPKDEQNSSFKSESDFSVFDYMPDILEIAMNNLTLPYNLVTSSGQSHHSTHNFYSQGFRAFVRSSISTVEFLAPPGEGGNTSWSGLRRAVRSAVGAGIVGQLPPPIYVCGTSNFNSSIHEELCVRWYQAAVTWPQILALPDRLPGGTSLSTSASLTVARALKLRSSLATYQHTVIAGFFKNGSPVQAPTSVYFPEESLTHAWDQFMWGEAILVGLVTLPGVSQVPLRLPSSFSWRHLRGGSAVNPVVNGTLPVTANLGEILTLVRPGYLVPFHQEIGNTTSDTMLNNLTLAVNFNCELEEDDENVEAYSESCLASGEIYFGSEEGDFLSIEVNSTHLILGNLESVKTYACESNSTTQSTFIQTVQLLGSSSYQVDTELCQLVENIVAISLA